MVQEQEQEHEQEQKRSKAVGWIKRKRKITIPLKWTTGQYINTAL